MTTAIEKTLEHVKFIARHLNHCDYSTVVILALMELGIPCEWRYHRHDLQDEQWRDPFTAVCAGG